MDEISNLIDNSIINIMESKENYLKLLKFNGLINDDVYNDFKIKNPIEPKINISFSINPKILLRYKKYKKFYGEYLEFVKEIDKKIVEHNKKYYKNRIEFFNDYCKNVEGYNLDNSQLDSIVHEDKNQLVIAGAGCGKTTTIIGKVKYLLNSNFAKPNEILLLSFTNASANEMKKRIEKELNIDNFSCYTFHKLGLEIIKKSTKKDVKIFQENLNKFIKDKLKELIESDDYFNKLLKFFTIYVHNIKDEFDFNNEFEYQEYLKTNPPTTLKGEVVKSYGELEIANFLYLNNIDYIYEKEYENDVGTKYCPDFYLKNDKIYIEYFGIDKNKNVPKYFNGKEGKSAKEIYNEGIKWKKKIHKENGTKLIDLYYYEKQDNMLLEKLKEKLKNQKVFMKPKTKEEIWNEIQSNNIGILDEISRIFETIINLIKSNNYSFDELYILAEHNLQKNSIKATFDLVKPIYNMYEEELKETNTIDFNDMINMSSKCIEDGKYNHNFKYVIVDEYQDISKARYNLLISLRKNNDYKLFCVGDDWQSIYRFSGSDVALIINFEKYFGKTYISKIQKTYRFSQKLAEISEKFVTKNPQQIRKELIGNNIQDFPINVVNAYNEEYCIKFLEEKLSSFEKNSTVYLLGRYNFDIDVLKNNYKYKLKYNTETGLVDIIFSQRRDLKISFLTVHKSKGLQADYVVILNNKKNGMGFPSKLTDIPAITVLLNECNDFEYAEERRVFYVALTRCKKKVFLLTLENNISIFAQELLDEYKTEIDKEKWKCPNCNSGKLIKRQRKIWYFLWVHELSRL